MLIKVEVSVRTNLLLTKIVSLLGFLPFLSLSGDRVGAGLSDGLGIEGERDFRRMPGALDDDDLTFALGAVS